LLICRDSGQAPFARCCKRGRSFWLTVTPPSPYNLLLKHPLPLYNRGEAQRIQEPSAQQAAGREDHFVHKVKALLFLPFRDEAQVYQGSRSKRIMAHKKSFGLPLVLILLFCLGALCPTGAKAQASTSNATSRLAGDWRSSALVTLTAAKPLMPQTTADLGTAASATRLERMLLLLHPSAAQQQALLTELANQQNPVSTEYHHWLTPAAYADSYANSSSDVAAVSAWLTSQGFKAAALPAGRGWIEFSGTVAQVEQAFQAQIDLAATASGTRLVLAGTISVPAALKPLVHGLVSLDGAFSATALTTPQTMTSTAAELAAETSLSKAEALTPQLAAQLLHLDTLHASGTNGAGQTIAIATRSNVRSEDVAAFRTAFGLPASALLVTPNGTDPGLADDQAEAVLSASWAGAGAPGARILLVPAGSTSATDGLDLSLAAIVDQALAHTVAVGYSTCEGALGEAHQAFYAALYQQAAAEGIAVIAASGDRGPSACTAAGSATPVSSGYSVNALASTPWNTAVGVAAFGSVGPAAGASALAAWSPASTADPAYAGGGGVSTLYAAPSWQPLPVKAALSTNASNLADTTSSASGQRLLPDVALPTALDSGVNHGLAFCLSSSTASSGCTLVRAGGSSAAASLFAGVAALVAEKNGVQGNLAPTLYTLNRTSGIYNDVQQGSAQLPCVASSPGCSSTEEIGYSAVSGYDLATGLGTVNGQALVSQWSVRPEVGSGVVSVALAITPVTSNFAYNPSAQVTLTASVVSHTGGATPTGTVNFQNTSTGAAITGATAVTLDGNGNASLPVSLSSAFTTTGSYNIVAVYSGDSTYETGTSVQSLTITTEKSCTTMAVVPSTTTPTAGTSIAVTVTWAVDPSCGAPPTTGIAAPTGTVTLNVNGGVAISYTSGLTTVGGVTTATFTVPVTSTTNALQAIYSGDTNYNATTAPQVTLTVTSTPTVVLTPATTTPTAGSTLALTATITPPTGSSTAPTGTVVFSMDGTPVGTAIVVAGATTSTASLTITTPAVGTHTLVAAYTSASGIYSSASSAAVTITVVKGTTTLTVTPATTAPAPGSSMMVTATLATTTTSTTLPTGTVTFTLDSTIVGTASLVSGSIANLTISVPATGTHTLVATYAGDTNYIGSTSSAVSFTVAKTTTTMVVAPATTTPVRGATLLVTASISAATPGTTLPTGTVTFTLDGVAAGVAAVTAGNPAIASITLPALTPGSHSVIATYSGDSYYAASTATSAAIVVAKTATTTVVTPATSTPTAGSTVAVTTTITPATAGATLPSGTVTYTVDGVSAGSSTVVAGYPSMATITLPAFTAGTHVLLGAYSGDTNYAASTSAAVNITAPKSTTVTVLTPSTIAPSAGSSLVATVSVATPNPLSALPIGTVTVTMDGASVGTGILTAGSPSTATVTIALVSAGSHLLQATYGGDTNYSTSTSSSVSIVAARGATSTSVTATPASLTAGVTESLIATVTPVTTVTGTTYTLTGTVSFYDSGILLGKASVSSGTATLSNVSLADNVNHSITAIYTGDTNWIGSASTALPLDATTLPDYVVLTSNLATVPPGQALILTATVVPTTTPAATGEQNPTGTVLFYNGITLIGTSALAASGTGYSSVATLTVQNQAGGRDTFTAIYQGDLYYDLATSNALTITVEDFTITPSPTNPSTNLNILQGSAGSASFDITGLGGFDNQIQVVCAVATQDDMTCTASPQQVTPTATVTFVVQTFITGGPSSVTTVSQRKEPMWPRAAGGTALAVLGFFLLPFGRRTRIFTGHGARRFWVLLLLLVGLGGVGMGCNSSSLVTTTGTPLGVTTIKITASAYVDNTVVSRSVYLSVNVLAKSSTTN